MPGLIAVGVSAAIIFAALFAFATGHVEEGVVSAIVAAVFLVGGLGWLWWESRRVRRIEAEYVEEHPDADLQPPAS